MITVGYRAGVSASPPTVEELTALRADNKRRSAEREHYRELYLRMLEQCRKLELGLLGQKSERLGDNDAQPTMGVLATLLGQRPLVEESPPMQPVREHERQKPTGRKPLPEQLPRVEVEVLPDDVQAKGSTPSSASARTSATHAERRPASLVVVRVIRPKFVRKDRQRMAETVTRRPPVHCRAASRHRDASSVCRIFGPTLSPFWVRRWTAGATA